MTESLSHVVKRDDDNDDDALSYSSDDTVYESDDVVSACCTPVCNDAPVPIRNTDNVRRHCRSTTPPSRNVTPVAKEGLFPQKSYIFGSTKNEFKLATFIISFDVLLPLEWTDFYPFNVN